MFEASMEEEKEEKLIGEGFFRRRKERNKFSLQGSIILPKILSPTFNKPHLSAELPAIIFFMKIPDTSESPDTLT